jgi:hypothetical protein
MRGADRRENRALIGFELDLSLLSYKLMRCKGSDEQKMSWNVLQFLSLHSCLVLSNALLTLLTAAHTTSSSSETTHLLNGIQR